MMPQVCLIAVIYNIKGVRMIFSRVREMVQKTGFLLIGIMAALGVAISYDVHAAPAKAVKPSSTQSEAKKEPGEWGKVVEAAKKEGKLVICGDPSEVWRRSLVDMFREEYPEIIVEYTGMNGRDFAPRLQRERELGQKLWDLLAGGTTTAYDLKRDGYTVPIRPLLTPENADDSKWIGGLDRLFFDKENKFIPAYTMTIQRTTVANRDIIKESELKSSEQLLDPKFKGKIVMQNPASGGTFQALGNLGFMYGENFVRDLLSKQNVIITDDKRQQAEWVVRGKYPIGIGFNETQLIPFVKQGLGRNVTKVEDKIIPVGTGLGCISLLKDAPHPNAARLYINWLLSKKTQTNLSKNVLLNSVRIDVPVVVKELAVDPAHLSNYRFYSTEENGESTMRLLPVIKEALKK